MNLEEQSFINLVNFFKPELERIMRGEKLTQVIPERSTRSTLHRHRVLSRGSSRGVYGGSVVSLTQRTIEVLGIE